MRVRPVLALAVAVLVAGVVTVGVRSGDDASGPAVAAAAVEAPARTVDADPEPLARLGVVPAPRRPATLQVDPTAPLPLPEDAPADPYAPTPEVRHGTLEIPAIGLSQPLFEGVTLTAINRGPSHWPGTAMPGQLGNVVVAGHRTTYTRPFWDLQALQPGDELVFSMNDGSRHVYLLDRLEIVDPSAVHIVDQTHAHTATLFACHPRGSARQRIVGHFTLQADDGAAHSRPNRIGG
jgi:LPXTG-site transpeptidase (sortase) family protein